MLLSPLILILLEANKSTWKSADPVRTRMEAILLEEGECVVAVEVTRAVQEAAREEAAFKRMEAAVVIAADEEVVANRRLHDPLVECPTLHEPFNHEPHESSNPLTSLFTPDLDPRYQHSIAPSRRFQYDLLTLPLSCIASAAKMSSDCIQSRFSFIHGGFG